MLSHHVYANVATTALGIILCQSVAEIWASSPAQVPSEPAFEVASVRVNRSGSESSSYVVRPNGVTISNYELRFLIARVYGIPLSSWGARMLGGPDGALSMRVDIQAKASGEVTEEEITRMMQKLLRERLALRVRSEVRDTPVYVLEMVQEGVLGPELRASNTDCATLGARLRSEGKSPADDAIASPLDAKRRPVCWHRRADDISPPPNGAMRIRYAGPLAQLISTTEGAAGRPIVDGTGLTGTFEWQMDFSPMPVPPPQSAAPSIFNAFREQLGLNLRPAVVPLEVMVIEAVELPSPN